MMQFNPDGSLRLPGKAQAQQDQEQTKLQNESCILVKRSVLNHNAPKKCLLDITVSKHVHPQDIMTRFFSQFKQQIHTPMTLREVSEGKYELEIGSDFKRCQECNQFIGHFRETLPGQVIDKKGNCTFGGHGMMW